MDNRNDMKSEEELLPTRKSLLSRLKNWDDDESWQVFFETYWKLIYTTARRAGLTEAEAQDAVQETIISVLKSMADFQYQSASGSFKSWLLQLTSWRIRDQLRKRKPQLDGAKRERTSTRTETVERVADPASLDWQKTWDVDWEQNLMQVAIQRVKNRVDAKAYQVFDLLVFKEWNVMRVARALRVNRAQVYLIKHRVGKLLKEEVGQLQKEEQLKAWSLRPVSIT
jgi:RNA polymerase sigma-70 factor (ECF subfamily)